MPTTNKIVTHNLYLDSPYNMVAEIKREKENLTKVFFSFLSLLPCFMVNQGKDNEQRLSGVTSNFAPLQENYSGPLGYKMWSNMTTDAQSGSDVNHKAHHTSSSAYILHTSIHVYSQQTEQNIRPLRVVKYHWIGLLYKQWCSVP